MSRRIGALIVGAIVFWTGYAGAANQVVVESKTVQAGATGVVIGVRVTNDTPLVAVIVPLKVREVTSGSFITRLKLSWGGRLDSNLTEIQIGNQYTSENYNCEFGGLGFHDTVTTIVDSSFAVGASPVGLMFARVSFLSTTLPIGADTAASMRLIVDVTTTPGTFEIDTSCAPVGNHLIFLESMPVNEMPAGIIPAFTKGIITIACNCPHQGDLNGDGYINVTDILRVIQIAFQNGADVQDPDCPRTRADVNNTGVVDVQDVLYIQDYVWNNGPAPVNPCSP
jgi:hypothetical protein